MKMNSCCRELVKDILKDIDDIEYWKDKELHYFVCYRHEVEAAITKRLK